MNLKRLLSFVVLLLSLGVLAQAQTFYVNNQTGNDANPGTSAQPKKTVGSALIAAPTGSTISVAATGIIYAEGDITIKGGKSYTFTSTGGTPTFSNAVLEIGEDGGSDPGFLTLSGPFAFNSGLELNDGTLTNGNQLLVGTRVFRSDEAAIVSGQLTYTGTINFTYDDQLAGASIITTGLEFPPNAGIAFANNLTVTNTSGAALTFQLNEDKTITGTAVVAPGGAGAFNLMGYTLNVVSPTGAGLTHTMGTSPSNGTFNFTLSNATSPVTIQGSAAGVFSLPNVTANATQLFANPNILIISGTAGNGLVNVNNVTANGVANITANNTGNVNDVTLNGSGAINVNNGGTVANVLGASGSTGNIVLANVTAAPATVMSLTQSGLGDINFGGTVATAINITNNVLLNTAFTLNNTAGIAGLGTITFPDLNAAIGGTLVNSASFSGSTNKANTTSGNIIFGNTTTTVNVTGMTQNSTVGGWSGSGSLTTSGRVTFANTTGALTFANVTNSSSLNGTAPLGDIIGVGGGAATVTANNVSNTSSNVPNHIDFSVLTGTNTLNNVSSSGAAGGDILFGNGNVAVTANIENSRTVTGADIIFGTAGTGGTTVTASAVMNSGFSLISFVSTTTGAVAISANLSLTGQGNVLFANATTATFALGNIVVNNTSTLLDFGAAAASGAINSNGTVQLVNGTVDMGGGVRTVTFSGASIQLGGATTNVFYANAATTTLVFAQPIPNVNQLVKLGTADQVYPGPVSVTNAAVLPAPFVTFQSINGSTGTPGSLIISGNNLTFSTPTVTNSIQLDNARLFVGQNDPGGSAGNFQNTSGYTTLNGGYVMMNGNAAQVVNAANPAAGSSFGNFGVDNSGAGVSFGANANLATFTGDFYLAEGPVNPANILFGGSAPNWPTVYRTEGTFTANIAANVPAANFVNVTYYGSDKATANEIPNAANDLWNLTVATTNGASPGQGVVSAGTGFTVNGTTTTNSAQTFYLNGQAVVLMGDLVNNGLVVNSVAVEVLQFGGTSNISGSGIIPSIQINDGATVTMSSPPGLVDDYFNGDLWGGAVEQPAHDGNVTHQTGGSGLASNLTLNFPALVAPRTMHFANLTTTADANETVTLGSNVVMGGNANLVSGTVNVATFMLTHMGNNFQMNGANGATVAGTTGSVLFNRTVDGPNELAVNGGPAVIGANVQIQMNAVGDFDLTTNNLTINGDVTLLDGPGAGNGSNLALATNLTAGGANFTVNPNSQVSGAGFLNLDAVVSNPGLTFNLVGNANANVNNLAILDNVTLAGGVLGNDLIVGTAFVHTAGDFNFGNADLVTNGTFTRTGGTYTGSGFLRHAGGAWNHGPAMVINNIDFTGATNIGATANTLTVNDYLRLAALVTQNAGTSQLVVGDGVGATTVEVNGVGNVSTAAGQVAPTFVGQTDYLFTGGNTAPNLFTWPTSQATNVTLNHALNTNSTTLAASRAINGNLDVTLGDLNWDSPVDVSFPNAASVITRRNNGSILNNNAGGPGTGTLTAVSINLDYTNVTANINTGIEYSLPTSIASFDLLPVVGGQTVVTIVFARTIDGTVSLSSILNVDANTTFAQQLTIPATATVNLDNAGVGTALVPLVTNFSAGVVVNGTLVNDVTPVAAAGSAIMNVTGGLTNAGVFVNNDVLNADGITGAGATTLGIFSSTNLTGDATFAALALPNAAAVAVLGSVPTINTANNLAFTAAWINTYLDLNFTGANAQTVALGMNRTLQDVSLNKSSDETVTFSGGSVTHNAAVGPPPAGTLNLVRGLLVVTDPNTWTLQLTRTGGVITGMGYTRALAQPTEFAHVVGKLGVFIPAGTIGRTEWPVGSINPHYRPAALTFTGGNATIANTTIFVSHIDTEPAGNVNLPLDGGIKFGTASDPNMIGGKAPYSWYISATTSLGAAQLFDLELQGTGVKRPFQNVENLRIMRRFDGDVNVNAWFIQGSNANYSNILQENNPAPGDTLITLRNQNSQGGIVTQAAVYTFGIPTQPPVFTVMPADGAINEGQTFNAAFTAVDQDANPSPVVYSVDGVSPALPTGATATIDPSTGAFEFVPGYEGTTQAYTFTVKATKANDASSFATDQVVVTVTDVNRAPVITDAVTDGTMINVNTLFTYAFAASDADGDGVTFAINAGQTGDMAITAAGAFTWTPTVANAGNSYAITVRATDNNATPLFDDSTFTIDVEWGRMKGDVDANAVVNPADAVPVLQYAVGLEPGFSLINGSAINFYAADVSDGNALTASDGDGSVIAYDAASILYSFANGGVFLPKTSVASGDLAYGDVSGEESIVRVPITIANTSGIIAAQFEYEIDEQLVEVVSVTFNTPDNWLKYNNTKDGKLSIAMAGTNPLVDGAVVMLELKIKDKESNFVLKGNAKLNASSISLDPLSLRQLPNTFEMSQNYPNPFNPTTNIKFQLPQTGKVVMTVYNMLGEKVKTLVNQVMEAGYYTTQWNGTNEYGTQVSSGVYIFRIQAGSFISAKKMNLIK